MSGFSRLMLPILGLGCVGLGWGLWVEYSELIALRASMEEGDATAKLRKDINRTQKDILAAKARLSAEPLATADDEKPDDPDRVARKKARQEAKRAAAKANKPPSYEEMMKDPEFRRLARLQRLPLFEATTDRVLAQMNLPPDKLQRLHDLLLDRQASFDDANTLAKEQGIDYKTDPKGFNQLMSSVARDSSKQIDEEVGPDALSQYYKIAGQQQTAVSRLSESLSYSQTPLTGDQAKQLAQIISQNPGAVDPNATAVVMLPSGGQMTGKGGVLVYTTAGDSTMATTIKPVSDAAINAAAGVLSADQLNALRAVQQEQQSQLALGKMYTDAQAAAPPPTKVAKKSH